MSPNMCFAAVVFQKVQIALKTGREFLELLVVFSLRTCIFALGIFSTTQKIKAIYLTFSICKRAILNWQQIFANYYIFSESQTKKKDFAIL